MARATAVVALLVAMVSAFWSAAQAKAQRAAVAPAVDLKVRRSGAEGNVVLTVDSGHRVRVMTVRVVKPSGCVRIGPPHAADTTGRRVTVRNPPGEVRLPADFTSEPDYVRLVVTLKGHGFGKAVVPVEYRPRPTFVY